MASISRSRGGSGGKMLRPRRFRRPATPYDRPAPVPEPDSPPPNPNWLSKLILSPTRFIASGAGKVLSSVFGPESSTSSSSSSSGSDDDIDNEDNDLGASSPGVVELHKENLSSEMIEPGKEAPMNVGKVGAKYLIEKLILQETFSREEFDRLTSIINSRIVEAPISLDGEGGRMSEVHDRANCGDVDMPALCSTAVVEAKKWLQERKLGSNSEFDPDNATPSVIEGEAGSPVDVAKSYMSARPPWASPCFNTAGQRCASPVRMQFSKEDTLFSIGGNFLSPSKVQLKRDSPISGSWNISEEIRKVRSKATEELLRASSSKKVDSGSTLRDSSMAKIDWPGSGHESSRSSFMGSNLAAVLGERMSGYALLVNASSDLPDPQAACQPSAQDDLQERVSPSPPALITEQIKDLEGDLVMTEGKGGLQDSSGDTETVVHSGAGCTGVRDGPEDINGFSQQDGGSVRTSIPEGAQTGGSFDVNGFPTSGASLSAGLEPERENHRSYDEEIKPVGSSIPTSPHAEETCELLSETSIEVPNVNESYEIDGVVATGSKNSANLQYEEFSQDLTQPHEKYSGTGKRRIVSEKQEGRKQPRYNRKGRGRGKQN